MHLLPPCGGYFRLVSSSPVATPPRRMRPLKFFYIFRVNPLAILLLFNFFV